MANLLTPGGTLSLAERIPRHTQRIHALARATDLPNDLSARWRAAEEAIYASGDPLVTWDSDELATALRAAWLTVEFGVEDEVTELQITAALIGRWFGPGETDRPSYGQHLGRMLSPDEVAQVRALLERQLKGQIVPWRARVLFLTARRAPE